MREERRILVVEDERTIADAVAARLRAEGFTVEVAADGPSGVAAAQRTRPDLVVLDIMLPGFDGLEVCRRLQAEHPVPVVMLTARDDETDLLVGLAVGADDYLTKPFSLRELAARVHAVLRRMDRAMAASRTEAPPIILGELEINRAERRVRLGGAEIHLTPTEFDLLALLSASPGRVISRSEMIQKVWGQGADLDLRSDDAHVYRLRRKIEPDGPRPTYIHAVPGIGYRFERRGLNERLSRSLAAANGETELEVAVAVHNGAG